MGKQKTLVTSSVNQNLRSLDYSSVPSNMIDTDLSMKDSNPSVKRRGISAKKRKSAVNNKAVEDDIQFQEEIGEQAIMMDSIDQFVKLPPQHYSKNPSGAVTHSQDRQGMHTKFT